MKPAHLTFDRHFITVPKIYTCIYCTKRVPEESRFVSDQIALVVETGDKIIYDWDEIDQALIFFEKMEGLEGLNFVITQNSELRVV